MIPLRSASRTIGRRLTLLIIGFSSLIALFTTGFQLFQDYQLRRDDLDRLLENPPLSYNSVAESVWNFDDTQIRLALEALARLPTVESVVIETEGGKNYWRTGNVVSPHVLSRSFPLHYATPDKLHQLGTLTIIASLDRIYERVLSHALVALTSNLLKTLLVAAFMLYLFRRLVTRRLEHLSLKVSQLSVPSTALAEDGAEVRREVMPGDEIDLLQRSFDELWRQLSLAAGRQQQAYQQLRLVNAELEDGIRARRLAEEEVIRLNTSLEQRVISRTEELTQSKQATEAANSQLRIEIQERRAAEQQLLAAKNVADQANVAKSRFLAAASHDLRQPIQAIGLFASALERSPLDSEQQRLCRHLALATGALGELLNTLLDISRLDAGVVKPRPAWIDVFDLFQRIDRECASLALARKLRFKLFFPQRSLAFVADVDLLMGVLRNIVGNAIKYTQRGGVLVGIRRRREGLLIQVWDTGIGIAPEHLHNIYDEYYQVDNAHRDRSGGMGLGLSIARRLSDLMGYTLDCRSTLGRGTVFSLRVPLTAEQLADVVPQAEGDEFVDRVPDLAGRRIVLIEDDPLVANALAAWLASHGVDVTAFADARSALADEDLLDADFYVSDFRLPGAMNGVELLDAIQQRAGKPIRAVLMTGDTAAERIDSFAAAAWKVLHKPVQPSVLLASLGDAATKE